MPGQFVGIRINDGQKDLWFRSYSLLSDEQGNLQICVKKVKDGRGSAYLHQVKQGDFIDILFPLGYFSFPEKLASNLTFIATGTGIVPILSLLENLPKDFSGKLKLFFGVRHDKDIFYIERIKKLESKFTNFDFTITLSKPSVTWQGAKWRVTDHIAKEDFSTDSQFFICGSLGVILSSSEILNKKGIKNNQIFYEDFN